MPFFSNILKSETWGLAADFSHISNPWSEPTDSQIKGALPALEDRIIGSVILAFSMLLVIPACLCLYWASKKVDKMGMLNSKSTEGKTDQTAKNLRLLKGNQRIETPPEDKKKTKVQDKTKETPSFFASVFKEDPLQFKSMRKHLDELFGNPNIIKLAPIYSLKFGEDPNYGQPETFTFPVMKGMWDQRPCIFLKVTPVDLEDYYSKSHAPMAKKVAKITSQADGEQRSAEEIFEAEKQKTMGEMAKEFVIVIGQNSETEVWTSLATPLGNEGVRFFGGRSWGYDIHTKNAAVLKDLEVVRKFLQSLLKGRTATDYQADVCWKIVDYQKVKSFFNL